MADNRPTTSSGGDRTDKELGPASPKSPRLEQEAEQQMSGFRRLSGAALYKSTFQASWTKKWPFVKPVKGDKTLFRCTVCSKVLSCAHQGERDVTRHIATTQHQRNAKTIQGTRPLSFESAAVRSTKEKVYINIKMISVQLLLQLLFLSIADN